MPKMTGVRIELTEYSKSGSLLKVHETQNVEITFVPDGILGSVDGDPHYGRQTTEVLWHEGKAAYLQDIPDVKIIDKDGKIVINWPICLTHSAPIDTDRGVYFEVLQPDD